MSQEIDAQRQRLTLLWHILRWEGRLNRARLQELFGLGAVRASEWIREFRDKYPRLVAWDSKARSYFATSEAYRSPANELSNQGNASSLAQYLAIVGLPHAAPDIKSSRSMWAAFPDLSVPHPRIFATLSEAIRVRNAVQITYRSMREPMPHHRVISPHSLIRAGRRWHVRAYCRTNQDFRDYALGRIAEVKLLADPVERQEQDDEAWMTQVRVRLVAHPDLSPEQEALIRLEYFDSTSARVVHCRGALVGYFIQDMRAATNMEIQHPPDYQLAIANLDEVRPWLFPG